MKKSIITTTLFCLISVSSALADSTVNGSIYNSTTGDTITNMAEGTQSEANLGAVKIK